MSTSCCCTHIDNPFTLGDFTFDFKKTLIDGGLLVLDFKTLIASDFRIVSIGDKSDTKSTKIVADPVKPDTGIHYYFNKPPASTYWETGLRTDAFTVMFKNMVTGEVVGVTVTIRSISVDVAFSPADITISVIYPYPDSLRVNINRGWANPSAPPVYVLYKTGYVNPDFVQSAYVSPEGKNDVWIDLQALAKQSTQTTIPYYVGNVATGPVNEESDVIGFANIVLEFKV